MDQHLELAQLRIRVSELEVCLDQAIRDGNYYRDLWKASQEDPQNNKAWLAHCIDPRRD